MVAAKKIALVTGASRGIGKAIVLELAKAGAIVLGVGQSAESAARISDYLNDAGIVGEGFAMDIAKPEAIETVMRQIVTKYGAPHILVNNAGITRDNLMLRMSEEEWSSVIENNLTSVFRLSRFCLREMLKARWGRIVNITSVVAFSGNGGQANYCASKGGVTAFSKALALEVASRNITVNCIAPGFIDTDMTKKLAEEQRERLLLAVPAKRIGQPEDIAHAVRFLASEEASYITGVTLHVNGGMYMI